jgi:hypothetical protein
MSAISGRVVVGAFIVAAVVAAIGAALVYVGSPGEARQRRFDDERETDLGELAISVNSYWRANTRLPASLQESAQGGPASVPRDPESDAPYEYRALGDRRYELCATFARPSDEPPGINEPPFRAHPAGRHCFTMTVRDQW